MSERSSPPSNSYLEPPRKSVELEDPGAPDFSNSDDEHFSDASEGNSRSCSRPVSGRASPVPRTRVEKVDDTPSHGDVPGTSAYEKREQDAVPDEIEVIPEGSRSRSTSIAGQRRSLGPGGSSIPRTMIEKVDPDEPSYGDVPGTEAYENRKADAVPDIVTRTPEAGSRAVSPSRSSETNTTNIPVPETLVSQVGSALEEETTLSGPHAHRRRLSDAAPDATEIITDAHDLAPSVPNSPTNSSHVQRKSTLTEDDFSQPAGGDDFDDFEEGQDDDFGDFDDGFQEPDEDLSEQEPINIQPAQPTTPPSVPPLIEFHTIQSLSDLYTTLDEPLDRLFPASKDALSNTPEIEPISNSSAIFNTERSLSLWSQLVAPPPLQPQNWVKSRIRRLFLVSLGVPVDLDEILPASKQKKLILPSINLGGPDSTAAGPHCRTHSEALKDPQSGPNSPRTSSTTARQRTSRRREPSAPPELDLTAVQRLCATTDAALDGFSVSELKSHVKELEQVTLRASAVLEFWLKLRDGLVSEKEAFEGVIENLVNHARRVRK
ncbi:hypothetical protein P175DRAFT_0506588 [Aspergillus ochraceoroseus IBT 24754]|uniref:Uncharacterized protein n=1 Tax=Aspergillus ochraceoroseus IBT 24754 TaxID=1392256 RepID=A0A2T5M950_9EURO|nr:uncharacterized protein P175DRAFT_0506588 [Aspergillus ochraceoroseus IBT 24754]PTU25060.1 hypothetical protein P175DRAFT_0506588 [Aspergillus ochraceoroseus IBT 24754]